jgi:hypothetical protein
MDSTGNYVWLSERLMQMGYTPKLEEASGYITSSG